MYDTFSTNYDRFVNWDSRLAYEMPFIEAQIGGTKRPSGRKTCVLDAACGTGMHLQALAERGYKVAGADNSKGMISRTREYFVKAGLDTELAVAGFGALEPAFNAMDSFPFDAILCLGNSLPHILSDEDLEQTLTDFGACLAPGGVLMIQNRNFDAVMANKDRWMTAQSFEEDEKEWLFMRFYDLLPDGLIDFNIMTLQRDKGSEWQQDVVTTRLRPQAKADLVSALQKAGFTNIAAYGDMTGAPFDASESGNLVVVAHKA